ncbi:MAG: tyrosine-protein phosphatase [Alphaproteobacteria bacterium]|nr:tyrosine-protein phosphatase [Alphaproteobacteria bacterium]
MVFVDHGIFRFLYANRHRVTDRLWRSSQPAPHQIAHLARKGVRTIVNLRGGRGSGAHFLEARACARAGIALVDFTLRSREPPDRDTILGLKALFDGIAYPALMHCKSGADRVGLAAALYLLLVEGRDVEEAKGQLSLRYGHVRQAKTGVLDAFLDAYATAARERPVGFLEWVETAYDPARVKADFHASALGNVLVDWVLRRE